MRFLSLILLLTVPGLCMAQATSKPSDTDEIEEAVLDSGPYPRQLVVNLGASLPADAPEWQSSIVQLLVARTIAEITLKSDAGIEWRPLSRMESKVRRNMDYNYRLLDYSVYLGTLDAEVSAIQSDGKESASAKVVESLRQTSLYEPVLGLLPKSMCGEFRTRTSTVQLQKVDGSWKVLE